ncbi:MAG: polysaccharide deacetylase family protein [Anaerolineae bacterium]|nr:polysaccharide deacetylase family protein [Anaerolineae bacterium]
MFRRHALIRYGLLMLLLCLFISPALAQETPPFRVYLAFEDGPTDAYTPGILDTLAAHGAHASFVIAGAQIAGHEDLLQREVREGHALINHLWEEQGVYAGAAAQPVIDSYQRTETALREALGDQLPTYDAQTKMFWQPGGAARPFPAAEGIDVITYNWNVNSDDCGWAMPASVDLDTLAFDEAILQNILGVPVSVSSFHNPYNAYDYGDGVIIIFHDLNRVTGRVLPTILSELSAAGASFETLPRPWDSVGTLPVRLAAGPDLSGAGSEGYRFPAIVREDARLRATQGLDGEILAVLDAGTPLVAVGRAPGWIAVEYDGGSGWVARELLDLHGALPNLPQRG